MYSNVFFAIDISVIPRFGLLGAPKLMNAFICCRGLAETLCCDASRDMPTTRRWKRLLMTAIASVLLLSFYMGLYNDDDVKDETAASATQHRIQKKHISKIYRKYGDTCLEKWALNERVRAIYNNTYKICRHNSQNPVKLMQNALALRESKQSNTTIPGCNTTVANTLTDDLSFSVATNLESYAGACVVSCSRRIGVRDQFMGHLDVFNIVNQPSDLVLFPVNSRTYHSDSFWIINLKPSSVPVTYLQEGSVAYFAPYWRDFSNIYTLLHLIIPPLYRLVQDSKRILSQQEDTLPKVLYVSKFKYMRPHVSSVVMELGFDEIRDFNNHTFAYPTCHQRALLKHQREETLDDIFAQRDYFQQKWKLTTACTEQLVLILQRNNTRQILNADKMAAMFSDHANMTNVKIVKFEEKTMHEQFDLVRCAKVFIAVQGAGVAWYRFLPKHATLVEIYYHGWKSKYRDRALANRPDMNTHAIFCTAQVRPQSYSFYALKWFGYDGPMSDSMKAKVTNMSAVVNPVLGNIWKDSDVVCSENTVLRMLSLILKRHS